MSGNESANSTPAILAIEKVAFYFVDIDAINRKLFFYYNSMKSIKKKQSIMTMKPNIHV